MRFSTQLLSIGRSPSSSASAPPSGSGCSRSPVLWPSRPGSSAVAGASTGSAHRLPAVIVVARRAGPGCRHRPPRAPRHTAQRRTSALVHRPGCRGWPRARSTLLTRLGLVHLGVALAVLAARRTWVAFTTMPWRTSSPRSHRCALAANRVAALSSCCSSRRQKFNSIVVHGASSRLRSILSTRASPGCRKA